MFKISSSEFIISGVKLEHYPIDQLPEIVFLGRSNVGKSTFINSFVNNKKLAYTSSNPGKTQVLNFFLLNKKFYLVDVPGYGYARVSKKQREQFGKMIEEYLVERKQLLFTVLLIDFKVGPTEDDILMYDFLQYYGISTLIIATKKDKVKKGMIHKHYKQLKDKLKEVQDQDIIIYSKEDRQTLNKVYEYFDKYSDYLTKEK